MARLKAKKNKGKNKKKSGHSGTAAMVADGAQHPDPVDGSVTGASDADDEHGTEISTSPEIATIGGFGGSSDVASPLFENSSASENAISAGISSDSKGFFSSSPPVGTSHEESIEPSQPASKSGSGEDGVVDSATAPSEAIQKLNISSSSHIQEVEVTMSDGNTQIEGRVDIPLEWLTGTSDQSKKIYAKICQKTSAFDTDCTYCWQATALQCEACGARFCQKQCRDIDHKFHKRVCSQFAAMGRVRHPYKDHFLSIVLPMGKAQPELVWCQLVNKGKELRIVHTEITGPPGGYGGGMPLVGHTIHINGSQGTARATLGHGLAMVDVYGFRSSTPVGLANINRCMHSLTTPGALGFRMGPWIAFAFEPDESGKPLRGIDVVPRDWRHVVDHIIYDPSNPFIGEAPKFRGRYLAWGVKLNNTNHPAISLVSGIERAIEDVCVPVFDWPETGPSALAFQIGLPWKIRYIRSGMSTESPPHMRYLQKYFRREFGADSSQWAAVDGNGCITFLVFSMALNRLVHTEHVNAFNKYLEFSLKRKIVPCRDGFMAYWEQHRQVLVARTNRNVIATPYHGPPDIEELIQFDAEDDEYRRGVMNLMGHFAATGFKMAIREESGVFVPDDIVVPFNAEGCWRVPPELFAENDSNMPLD